MTMNVGLEDLNRFAAADEESRRRRLTPVEILDYRPTDDQEVRLAAPGSITLFVGRRGDERLRRLREIADGGQDDGSLAAGLREQHAARRPLSPDRIKEILENAGVYATLRCGARTLAAHIVLPGPDDLAVIPCAYNGGRLPAEDLTLVEHLRDDSEDALEVVALKADPVLTAAEAAALELVGDDQLELNIAPNADCAESMTAYAILILIALAISVPDPSPIEHLDETALNAFGPERSARELMSLRQRAIRLQR